MSSTYGENLKLSIFGQSHGPAIGMTLDGIPAGLPVDFDRLQAFLNLRAPGQNDWSTPRKEEDNPEVAAVQTEIDTAAEENEKLKAELAQLRAEMESKKSE